MLKTIEFFENKGKTKLKSDYHEKVWYADFIEFLKKEKVFATLLTPSAHGGEGCRWDTYRNCAFNEILGFYGLPYWYTWQVTILGLGPIWMGANEAALVSTFGKDTETDEYVFFVVNSKHDNFDLVKNVVSSQNYVAEYALQGYPKNTNKKTIPPDLKILKHISKK